MDCIPYINDLQIEVQILKDVKANGNCDLEKINEQIKNKEELIKKCKDNLSKLSSNQIYYRLYLKILSGMKPSKAIEEIADENYINGVTPTDITTLWKDYYKKIKKICNTPVKPQ